METEETIKDVFWNMWKSRPFQLFIDVLRLGLFILMIVIVVILLRNIEEVKILNSDVCAICMNKTGATCFVGDYIEPQELNLFNKSKFDEYLIPDG